MSSTLASSFHHPGPPLSGPTRLLAGWLRHRRTLDWGGHHALYGPLPGGGGAGRGGDPEMVAVVERAGLRGRGGAGFPTARKLAAVAAGARTPIVVANGCEGDGASSKDHLLLGTAPHLVLDGIEVAARAVGADEAVLCVHRGDPVRHPVRAAMAQRPPGRLLPRLVDVPPRYVASADTALVNLLDNAVAVPTGKPPRPSRRGVSGRPTLVDNVETLAHLALIARYGDAWFRGRGTEDSPGTTLVTVGGAVRSPGVYEVELGEPVHHALGLAGGTVEPLQAVLLGGLAGSWLPLPAMHALPLADPACRRIGVRMGIAALVALPLHACGLDATARILRYLAAESAGQCGPCMFGLPAIADDFTAIATGRASPADLNRLRTRLAVIPGRGACAHPDAAVTLARSALRTFELDLATHLSARPCPAAARPLPLPIPQTGADAR